MALIELKNIEKEYRNDAVVTQALSGVDLCVDAGEFVAVMGTSGSGKTTLLNIIGCMDVPTFGTYLFDGEDLSHAGERKLSSIRETNSNSLTCRMSLRSMRISSGFLSGT